MDSGRTLIVIPTFNERANIVALIDRVLQLYPQVDILIVDDSSQDSTADAVREAQARHGERLQLLVRAGKGGRGSAVLAGFQRALAGPYAYAMEMDADFSHKPEEIALFWERIKTCDCVIGSRYLPGSEIHEWGWKRTFFSHYANLYARTVLRIPISDYTNGFRLYTRKALEAIELGKINAKGYVVLSEVAYQLFKKGMRFGEVPTVFVNRRRGVSNLGFHEINEAFFSVLRIRWPRSSRLLESFGAFGVRGVLGAVVDLLTLAILAYAFRFPAYLAIILSSIVAVAVMFGLRVRRWGGQAGSLPVGRFLLVYGGTGILLVLLAWGFLQIGVSLLTAKLLGIIVTAPFSYVLSRKLLG
jgi:dolichol-phosphate mannosyltransferase